jgi:hypothetical protein
MTEEEMALFTPKVRASNTWSRRTRAEYGHLVYETVYKYRVRFLDHTRYLMKHDVHLLDRPLSPRALHFGCVPSEAPVEGTEVPVEDASVVPMDVTSSGTKSGSKAVSREPSVASGQGSMPRSVHAGAIHKLGVAMASRSSIARRIDVASLPPPPRTGEMVNVLGRLDALQSTMASLVGRVAVVEVAVQRHTDMAASIDGRFDQLMGIVQGLHGLRGVVWCTDHCLLGRWACRPRTGCARSSHRAYVPLPLHATPGT